MALPSATVEERVAREPAGRCRPREERPRPGAFVSRVEPELAECRRAECQVPEERRRPFAETRNLSPDRTGKRRVSCSAIALTARFIGSRKWTALRSCRVLPCTPEAA